MRRVLVTGGSRGIGRAVVEKFANMGDTVAFIYCKNDEKAKELAEICGAKAIKADISKPEEAKAAVDEALDYLGFVDVLVNNAGISQIKLFTDLSDYDWENMISVNLSSVFYVTRSVLKGMINRKSGRIVNIGSMWGKCGASCEVHYSAAKAGIRGMTMALAKEVGLSGITVNCVEPGVIDTEMNGELDEETLKGLKEETPLGRIGQPCDVAELVEFLSSDRASFITGQVIGVDGGYAV